ncbi:MAG TPA: MBL fold metallo-hydrolase [Actinomycetota bacterium]|nr:MBL fold metallo-hydrolase [Actinomycetota bacterium]
MRARIWGCRGSLASPGPETVRYGGNTSCVELRTSDDSLIILDAGTGIRPLGLTLLGELPRTIHIFLTHLHLDHLEGLGFFSPLWESEVDLHIWGPPSPVRTLERRIARYLSPPLFPIHLQDIPSRPTFHDVPDDEWKIGTAVIRARPISHRGPTVGYRISENGQSLAYIPDHEPALGIDLRAVEPEWVSGHGVAHDARVLLHDAQYTEDEYPRRVGWGHSSVAHVATFAEICSVQQLVMFHHDPLHTDDQLEVLLSRARELWGGGSAGPVLAHEGMELDLS